MNLSDDCPRCGSESPGDGETARAFVRYVPRPNDVQEETDWGKDLPELRGLVCTECGYVIGVIDTEDPEGEERRSSEFRVDEELG